VKAEFGERTNIVPFTKIYDKSEDCLGQNGVDGFTITVDRVFYVAGKEVRREPITTRYKPAPDVTCGKKPHKKPAKNPADTAVPDAGAPTAPPSATPSGPAPSDTPSAFSNDVPSPSPSPTKKPKGQ
jgi:hypothetical protein